MNSIVRAFVSKTKYYQKKKMVMLNPNRDISTTRLIYAKSNTMSDKIMQYDKLFKVCKIENFFINDFLYLIDESVSVVNINHVIDNSPIDYNLAVNCSIIDIVERASDNPIKRCNKIFLGIVQNYITRIIDYISNNEKIPDINRHKDIFSNMLSRPADNLHDALQRILFWNQILWQTGHYLNGLGRLDIILDRFPIDADTERELTNFFIVLNSHYKFKSRTLIGDIGQIIVLGGCDKKGMPFENEYTSLIIQILDRLHITDPKILLRVNMHTSEKLYKSALHSIASGIGSPLFSNDEVIIPSLTDFGYDLSDARNYGVSACWEPLSIGNSLEQNNLTNIEFGRVMCETMTDPEFENCSNFAQVQDLYFNKLGLHLNLILKFLESVQFEEDPIYTLFCCECVANGKSISNGGAKYSNYGLLSVGLGSAVSSMCNINDYVFKKKYVSLEQIRKASLSNFINDDKLFEDFQENSNHYGNDSVLAITLTNKILDYTVEYLKKYRNRFGGKVKFGLSSPGYIDCGKNCGATLDGRKSGEPFSTHISSDYGDAVTAIFNFAMKIQYSGFCSNGNVVDTFLDKSIIENNEKQIIQLVKNAVRNGLFQCQFNVVSYEELINAKNNPHEYKQLIVRVWGFSAYFNDLPEEYKDFLIERAKNAF